MTLSGPVEKIRRNELSNPTNQRSNFQMMSIVKHKHFLLLVFFVIFGFFSLRNQFMPLEGVHKIRQADTLFTGLSYCYEGGSFFEPRIVQRGINMGISIGELPVFSYLISLPCKATGVWSEAFPKLFNFVFLILGILVWHQALTLLLQRGVSLLLFATFYFFSTNAIVHYQIPIPDHFALFLMGCCFYFEYLLRKNPLPTSSWKQWLHSQTKLAVLIRITMQILVPCLFATAFLMRPYLIPLIAFFILPLCLDLKALFQTRFLASLFLSIAGYVLWYKWWAPNHTTLLYYNTILHTPLEVFAQWRGILKGIYEQFLRSYLNFIGIFLLAAYLFRKNLFKNERIADQLLLLALLSYLFVVLIKGDHGSRHGYYFSAFFIFLTMSLTLLTDLLVHEKFKNFIMYGFVVIGIANTQHYFHGKFQPYFNELVELRKLIPLGGSLVATYAATESNDPVELYVLQRIGYAYARTDLPEKTRAAIQASPISEIPGELCPNQVKFLLIGFPQPVNGKNYQLVHCAEKM